MKELNVELLKELYLEYSEKYPDISLDQKLQEIFNTVRENYEESFDEFRKDILKANNINEYDYYTKSVNIELKNYIEENIFPQYENNDKAHGIVHILEVIRRSFALMDSLKLNLDSDLVYAIASYHDLGKFIDHENHEKIAAEKFIHDENMKRFFNDKEREIIKEAIQDHRSSFSSIPRSDYGKLISSADRNTRIEIVFIRSFFVGQWRTPDKNVSDFLEFTFQRLKKRYSEENPENMFFVDETYKNFLKEMRDLLKDEIKFKNKYCEVNHINSKDNLLSQEKGINNYN